MSYSEFERYLLSWESTYNNLFDRTPDQTHLDQYAKERSVQKAFYEDLVPYWHVSILATSPDYQRRGVGTLLVREGQRLALLDDVPLVLESSLAGRGLYEKNGFERLWEGNTCGLDDVCMVWCPEAQNQLEDRGGLEVSKEREDMLRRIGKLRGKMATGITESQLRETPHGTWGEFVKGQDE
jgi:GNAT superfamily N-acetyltransferase